MFKITKKSPTSNARLGMLVTAHGKVPTPFFMPIATKGSVKALSTEDLLSIKADIILSNAYHLYLRPGMKVMEKCRGLHSFMQWNKPILTDSGGYQIFSFRRRSRDGSRVKLTEHAAEFQSHIDGSRHVISPEMAIDIQLSIGSDVIMVLDECTSYPSAYADAKKSSELTSRWALRCFQHFEKKTRHRKHRPLLFAIVQGSTFKRLRLQSARELMNIPFDGYAVGGLAVGESNHQMTSMLEYIAPKLPLDKPRYLMGVGTPENIIGAVKNGIDMFDCVLPTRNARHGLLYVWTKAPKSILNQKNFYRAIRIKNKKYAHDMKPLCEYCDCPTCKTYSRAYLRHLFNAEEPLALKLATMHNVRFYTRLMEYIRKSI